MIQSDIEVIDSDLVLLPAKKQKVELITSPNSLYSKISKNILLLTIPNNWFASLVLYTPNILMPTFHKVTLLKDNYKISIEKQLIITEGNYSVITYQTLHVYFNLNSYYSILDSKLIIHINGKELAFLEVGLSDNVIKTEDNVEDLLNIFDEIKCCDRVTPSKELLN
ncbi:uncharacterized protein LOC132926457 isoform X1 [Rhopalosiphum padi]|uniref:uncharacterized protein LOC132926457 isoform X1 n=1 Tax=Rhopalosiphum padi TaxID=40932 RepID=UPI00298D88BF|nr:uncharacterized protein LOC132926457 isoform X1 [Rhopalosiphum padi]